MPTKAEIEAAQAILRPPQSKDPEVLRARRLEVKDILNSTLLGPEARKGYEGLYAALGDMLVERASKAAS